MNDFIKMDIFFAVTTIESVLITALLAFAIWRVLRILEHVERLFSKAAGEEAERMRADVAYARGRVMGLLDALLAFVPRKRDRDTHSVNQESTSDPGQASS